MDIIEIQNTIKELEDGPTTFDSCIKLASLYTVADKFTSDEVEEELDDILPAYKKFCNVKQAYQLGHTTMEAMLYELTLLSTEIQEFIETMYSSTNSPEERHIIVETLTNLYRQYVENP